MKNWALNGILELTAVTNLNSKCLALNPLSFQAITAYVDWANK